ncbi:MAG: hypothetical protein AB7K41_12875, partial [Bdellovibrionales bacterium]
MNRIFALHFVLLSGLAKAGPIQEICFNTGKVEILYLNKEAVPRACQLTPDKNFCVVSSYKDNHMTVFNLNTYQSKIFPQKGPATITSKGLVGYTEGPVYDESSRVDSTQMLKAAKQSTTTLTDPQTG